MNSVAVSLTLAFVGWISVGQNQPLPATPSPTTNAPPIQSLPPITSEPVVAPTLATPPNTISEAASTNLPPLSLTLAPALTERVVAEAAPSEEVQRRLEAPSPEKLMEKYGTMGFLIRNPEPRNFLEMINPFAPAEFGGKRREIYNRNPNLKPGATLPRNFIRDGIRNEPDMMLIGWPW